MYGWGKGDPKAHRRDSNNKFLAIQSLGETAARKPTVKNPKISIIRLRKWKLHGSYGISATTKCLRRRSPSLHQTQSEKLHSIWRAPYLHASPNQKIAVHTRPEERLAAITCMSRKGLRLCPALLTAFTEFIINFAWTFPVIKELDESLPMESWYFALIIGSKSVNWSIEKSDLKTLSALFSACSRNLHVFQ